MSARTDQREAIATALNAFENQPLADAGSRLFATLGYQSDRRIPIATPKQFCEQLDPQGKLSSREREALDQVKSLHLLFQFSDAELAAHADMFDDASAMQATKIESYLFFVAELAPSHYTRTALATLVRAINKPLPMPALVLFRHGDTVSLGIIHRRLHKRDQARDVLEKVTLIKDIAFADPIRAHVEILNDFVLENLDADFGIANFVGLHEAWQKRLGSYALSNAFYREIADWYFWAHHQVEDGTIRLPQHCDTEQEKSLFLIRLLTRIIFCWFLVEKRLIPTDLFREHRLKALLKEFNPSKDPKKPDSASTYYHAILQNLFFGTLSMPPAQRAFREKKKDGERYDQNFGITNLWRYETDFRTPSDWLAVARRVPFLNGGLFDCLDDKVGKKTDNFILDGFSDNPKFACHLPNDLFFGPERIVDLSHDYGEEDKRAARSKKAKVRGLIEILARYKFTIEENTPLEEEIALDPELLGKVFENLLASFNEDTQTTARKALGAFYTPREIVSYMVDEALKSYLGSQVPRCKGALEDLFSNKATLRDIRPDAREALIAAIGRVKILDPACGSGAFPMGALHRLVDLLKKLDPNNESWKRDRLAEAQRSRQVLEGAGAAKDEISACDARIADIEKSFDTRFHDLDFARKLYLIENSIYGVDIQPIATQIAKLRFFISLIVDQKIDTKADNLGVRPLPNLETRLVAADTLVPIEKEESDLFSLEIDSLRDDLARIRHEHFNARSPATKRKWREADEAKRSEIADLLETNHSLTHKAARKLAAWDPYDQNSFAPFFDVEWMFGRFGSGIGVSAADTELDNGFDIVIGNPPYIRIQTLKKKNPKLVEFYKSHYASAAKGNYDLYVVFVEAGLRLLKSDGHLAFICPHKFFNAQYGEPLRELIGKGRHLRHIVHFGDQQVFFGATIYTCLLFLAKSASPECRFVSAHDLGAWRAKLEGQEGKIPATTVTASDWNFNVGVGSDVFERLQGMPTRLGQIASGISQGIRTSANEVYVLDVVAEQKGVITAYSKQLDTEVKLERKAVRQFLQGREIKPFAVLPSGKVVIIPYVLEGHRMVLLPFSEISKATPLTAGYLSRNRGVLQAREEGRMEGRDWHGFVYPKNLTVMMQPKLLVPDIADRACFALDEVGQYAFTSGYGIIFRDTSEHPLKFMLGLCNSRILDFYWRRVSTPLRGGFFRYFTQFIEQLPVADSSPAQRNSVSLLADYLIRLNRSFAADLERQSTRDPLMLAYWERVLNGLVYELYFPAEVHEAGLHLFDLVDQSNIPDVCVVPESTLLRTLRTKFEELYDGTHPLRIALDKLQTLDTVRIIEGKS
jgi:adenine-specific DNA-methyltransferase